MKKYKNIETWKKAMQKDKSKKLWADYFNIGGHLYTIEEYDESGKYMRFTSPTAWTHIDIETSNRYSDTWLSDMEITEYSIDDIGFRFDISYYIDENTTKKQLKELKENLKRNEDTKQLSNLLDFLLK
jgi:hypothetical protein